MLTLKEEDFSALPIGCAFHFADSESEIFLLHDHEYYEFFLCDKEPVLHCINGTEEILPPYTLVLIRPRDRHTYRVEKTHFSFSNLAFSRDTAEKLFGFIGDGFPTEELLTAALPPRITLSGSEYATFYDLFRYINTFSEEEVWYQQFFMRSVIYRLLSLFYPRPINRGGKWMPMWLEKVCRQLQKPENLFCTEAEVVALAGKSREHVCRCFRKYLNSTVSGYLTNLRLDFAANLLLHSNKTVTSVCYESGFNNLSWFYKQFSEKYGVTPRQFQQRR